RSWGCVGEESRRCCWWAWFSWQLVWAVCTSSASEARAREQRTGSRRRRGPHANAGGRRGAGGAGALGSLDIDPAAQRRLADPVRGRVHVARQRDLLLAGGDRGTGARADAAGVRDRGP